MRGSGLLLKSMSAGTLLFLYLPIAIIILFSFNASPIAVEWGGATLAWYQRLARNHDLWLAARNSLIVGSISTIAALILGLAAAVVMERGVVRSKSFLDGVLILPLVIPEVMMGVALLLFFVIIKWPLGLMTVTIGHSIFNLSLVTMILRARLRKIDPVWEEAARDLGASSWQAFYNITLPLLRQAIIGSGLMAFTISLDDFVVTFFTTGPGATTLPLKVFSMMRTGITPEINALSAILVIISMLLIGIALIFQRK